MNVRDRVIELRRVRAGDLLAHPANWRTHPPAQQRALRGVLDEIGFAGAVLARQREDGRLELIDGHLRAETVNPEERVPVLVLDLTAAEADTLLAVFDPISALAGRDQQQLERLLASVPTANENVRELVERIRAEDNAAQARFMNIDVQPSLSDRDVAVPESYQVLVDCRDETDQRALDARLTGEGYTCRILTL